jgi:hypothetical protein
MYNETIKAISLINVIYRIFILKNVIIEITRITSGILLGLVELSRIENEGCFMP